MMLEQLRLDGTVDIMLPDATATNLPLERLTRLYDGLEQLEDMWDDDLSDSGDSLASDEPREQIWALNEQGEWEADPDEDGDDWSTDEDGMNVDGEEWSQPDPSTLQPGNNASSADEKVMHDDTHAANEPVVRSTPSNPNDVPRDVPVTDELDKLSFSASEENLERYWKRFDILPSAPIDHAFYASIPAQPSRQFLARLTKEYRVLASSLPGAYSCRNAI